MVATELLRNWAGMFLTVAGGTTAALGVLHKDSGRWWRASLD